MIVLDTSALLYWTLDPKKLSPAARQAIDGADYLVISSISVWEIALKVKRGKLEIPLMIDEFVERLNKLKKLEILSVDVQTWLDNLALKWAHRDPADRTIVAIAQRYGCPLVASDCVIADFYEGTIW
ncbi:MAG: type II toxin-antitoxin system VapC family toxin [Chloroflexota bacterium]|nr:type II toxin-antitoxin system VapC family toxin [Chloroflexota bacterium]